MVSPDSKLGIDCSSCGLVSASKMTHQGKVMPFLIHSSVFNINFAHLSSQLDGFPYVIASIG